MSDRPKSRCAYLMVPSEDWELNVLLLRIAKNLNEVEFDRLKFLCSGFGGVQKRVLENLKTPEMLFTHLKEKNMISRDNLLLLQAFMCHLDREDLRKLAADYARQVGDVLYFHSPDAEPAEGFKHIQFHVEGNLDSFQRSELEALRATLSRLLFVPEQYIILRGVEPGGSLNLTFMIRDTEADSLKDLFKEHKDRFARLGVDGISVDESEYIDPTLKFRRRSSAPDAAATQEQLRVLYRRSLHLETQVQESEIRALESLADATLARQEAIESSRKENYFRCLLARVLEEKEEIPKRPAKRRGSFQSCETKAEMGDITPKPPVDIDEIDLLIGIVQNHERASRKPLLRRGSLGTII
ncbi:poly [ADP-ribose] polymerase [Elysia marginata]|uniref:Poly [ADP-ribose] polymerase n=1 Tax=Elysia marginata TaxID=1093978 RepID=A0AAV4ISA1_9GAST|nr:poly [ADP-ribose] polymerase [Elysia marginata]